MFGRGAQLWGTIVFLFRLVGKLIKLAMYVLVTVVCLSIAVYLLVSEDDLTQFAGRKAEELSHTDSNRRSLIENGKFYGMVLIYDLRKTGAAIVGGK